MEPLKFGIIGCGNVANVHAQAIRSMESALLAAACSRSISCLDEFCSKYECRGFPDPDRFLKEADIDIVAICTPSGAHAEPACQAAAEGKHVIVEKPIEVTLEAAEGKHVIVEKPIEVTLDRADRIIEACAKNGVQLGVIFQSRFNSASRLLKRAIEKNLFGRLTLGSAYVKWYRPQEYYDSGEWRGTIALDGGGALMNQSIHAIDLLRWFMGDVSSVQAFTGTLAHEKIEVEDTGAAILRFGSGALGVIEGSTAAFPGYAKRIEISGEKGTVVLTEDRITEWSFAEPTELDDRVENLNRDDPDKGGVADPMAIDFSGHKAQFEDFVNALQKGSSPLVDGREGRKTLEVVLALYEASARGRRVDLPLG